MESSVDWRARIREALRRRRAQVRPQLQRWSTRLRHIKPRQAWPYAMMLAGLLTLVYVVSQYGSMAWTQHRLARQWQRTYEAQQAAGPQAAAVHDDGLIRVSIPKIDLDAIVVEGTSRKSLLDGPGHLTDTAEPGETGNAVISAHRDTFFRHIYELSPGDDIIVRRRGQVFRFQVTGKKIVQPDDMAVTKPTNDAQLTLITCYPTYYIGPAPERLVVFSKLVDHGPDNGDASSADAKPVSPAPGVAQ